MGFALPVLRAYMLRKLTGSQITPIKNVILIFSVLSVSPPRPPWLAFEANQNDSQSGAFCRVKALFATCMMRPGATGKAGDYPPGRV